MQLRSFLYYKFVLLSHSLAAITGELSVAASVEQQGCRAVVRLNGLQINIYSMASHIEEVAAPGTEEYLSLGEAKC